MHWPSQPFEVRSSPGRFTYCAVSETLSTRATPSVWPGGHRSIVDQVCLDIAASDYEAECTFWSELTGWELRDGRFDEFRGLQRPDGQPVGILLQRVGDKRPKVTAHLDLASDDRASEVRRHAALGAEVLAEHEVFTVLRDAAGLKYCVTDRDPDTGLLP